MPNYRKVINHPPGDRPLCQWCSTPLEMWADPIVNEAGTVVARKFLRWKGYADLFCSLRCALYYAEKAHDQLGFKARGKL